MYWRVSLAFSWFVLAASFGVAAEWNQWRGPNRDGVAESSPALIDSLPQQGLKPIWISEEILSGNDGGWGSPIVTETNATADGESQQRVYLFAHKRIRLRKLEPKKYPWLPPEKRVGMTEEEYRQYEVKRRDEDEERANAFQFLESIYCIDAKTGKTLWKNEQTSVYSRFPQSGSLTAVAGRLYILGAGRHARCLDAETGDDIWNVRVPGNFRDESWQSSFAIADGVAVLMAGHLFGLDISNGEVLWQGDPAKTRGTHTSPVVWRWREKEYVIVNVAGRDTIGVEPKTGKELWRVASEANFSTPIVVGNRLVTYGNSRKKGLRCFQISEEGAKHLWTFQGLADKGSSPVAVDGYVYVQGERRLACVDLQTGKAAWTTMLDYRQPQFTSLIAADGKVMYALEGFLCFEANADQFTPLINAKMDQSGLIATEATFRKLLGLNELEKQPGGLEKSEQMYQQKIGRHGPLACATPAIADGKIYIRLRNGIACYDLRQPNSLTDD